MTGVKANGDTGFQLSSYGNTLINGGAVTMALQPAFLAVSAAQQANIASGDTIIFGTEVFDQGGDYASNIFTAPVTGRYQFNVIIRADNITASGSYKRVILITSNKSYTSIFDPEAHDQTEAYHTFVIAMLVDMDASDTATVVWSQSGGDTTQDIDNDSYFSGYLAC